MTASTAASAASLGTGRPWQHSTRLLFLLVGFLIAAWASLVPTLKAATGVDEGELGMVLLCLGVGSMITMPLSGALCTRYGCRSVLTCSGLILCLCLPLLASITSVTALAIALFIFGAMTGAFDCVMNIQAVIVERHSNRPLMSGFHGFYSLGGLLGAVTASGIMNLGASPLTSVSLIALTGLLMLSVTWRWILPYGIPAEGPAFAVPHGEVLLLGVLCFIVFLVEGSMMDWSGLLLTEKHHIPISQSGYGFGAFSLAMTLGRLCGDRVVTRAGRRAVIVTGALLGAAGILMATHLPYWQAALLGYALVGLGCSNIVPVLFSAVGRQNSMPQAVAIPALTTLGYAGVLAGPAGIGFIAHHSSLPIAFLVVTVLMLGVALSARYLKV